MNIATHVDSLVALVDELLQLADDVKGSNYILDDVGRQRLQELDSAVYVHVQRLGLEFPKFDQNVGEDRFEFGNTRLLSIWTCGRLSIWPTANWEHSLRTLRRMAEQVQEKSGVEDGGETSQVTTEGNGQTIGQSDKKSDKAKKTEIKKRRASDAAVAVGKSLKAASNSGDKLSKEQAAADYVEANGGSVSSIVRVLTDNQHLWKIGQKSDKNRTT